MFTALLPEAPKSVQKIGFLALGQKYDECGLEAINKANIIEQLKYVAIIVV